MFKRSANGSSNTKAASAASTQGVSLAKGVTPLPPGKHAYEARRAAKAGVSLDRWMADKQKRAQAELEAARRTRLKVQPARPGFLKRLLDRAHKPL